MNPCVRYAYDDIALPQSGHRTWNDELDTAMNTNSAGLRSRQLFVYGLEEIRHSITPGTSRQDVLMNRACNYGTLQPADRDSRAVPETRSFIPDGGTFGARALPGLLLAAALWLTAADTSGQGLRGRVVDEAGLAPVAQAQLEVVSADGRWQGSTQSDSAGLFRIVVPRADVYRVSVTHVAYVPWTSDTLRVGTAEMLLVEVRLGRTAIPLQPIVITARGHPRLAEFDERRLGRTFGRFLTREEVEARGSNRTSELLRTMPGILVQGVTRRGRTGPTGNLIVMRGGVGTCLASIFIDGVSTRQYPESTIDDMLSPGQIEGVEVYTSASAAPARYNEGTGCGVVLFWTRTGYDEEGRPWNWKLLAAAAAAVGLIFLVVR